jgi:DDE superfamily endonuclease
MEDVLYQYQLPYDVRHPLICFDERPCFLIEDVGGILPMSPGKAKRYHYEYQKNGSCCVFLAFEPHTGFRYVEVRERRTASDYAQFMQTLLTRHYPEAQSLRLVQDNLNTHTPGSFYEVCPAAEAFALAQKFEVHYTPKKGSWLNMAEIEFAALSTQCLDRRIPDLPTLRREVLAWATRRNKDQTTVEWKFAQPDARRKLHRHYETVQKFL